jgi:hypothetical protein
VLGAMPFNDASISLMFEIELTTLKQIAIASREKCRERGEKTFGWCFYDKAGDSDNEGDRRRKRDLQSPIPSKRARRLSPVASPKSNESQYVPSWSHAPADLAAVSTKDRTKRNNVLRRFNLATSTPNLKLFIRAAKSAGADVDSDDFDDKVIEQQLIKLKEANEGYMRKKLSRSKKQFSKKMLEDMADEEYTKTYAASFEKGFKPILIKNHIRYAVEYLQKQVRLKIQNRKPLYEKEKMNRLKKELTARIDTIEAGWKKGASGTRVLKEFFKHRRALFQTISEACPDYAKGADDVSD